MLKDLTYLHFWHVEGNDLDIPTKNGHYDHKADKYPWIIKAQGKRSKKFGRYEKAKEACRDRNFRDFGIRFSPREDLTVYDSAGKYLESLSSPLFNFAWNDLQSMTTLDSTDTTNCKIATNNYSVWSCCLYIEDYGYTAYSATPHHTNLIYVYDAYRVLIALYDADHNDRADTVGEIDYVIQVRAGIKKREIEQNL